MSVYSNGTLKETFGFSEELKTFMALPEIDELSLEQYLISNCDESITSTSQFPDPFLFKGMKEAVNLFIWALKNHKRILCVSDSDADGVG